MKLKQILRGYWERARALSKSLAEQKRISSSHYDQLAVPATLVKCLDEPAVALIGESYRRAYPDEPALDWSELVTTSDSLNEGKDLSTKERRRLLQKRINDDFAQGRIVRIQGWLLSKTEARQCALASSMRAKPGLP